MKGMVAQEFRSRVSGRARTYEAAKDRIGRYFTGTVAWESWSHILHQGQGRIYKAVEDEVNRYIIGTATLKVRSSALWGRAGSTKQSKTGFLTGTYLKGTIAWAGWSVCTRARARPTRPSRTWSTDIVNRYCKWTVAREVRSHAISRAGQDLQGSQGQNHRCIKGTVAREI